MQQASSLLQLYSESVPVNVSSPRRETREERISVHLFCPKLGITEECENKKKKKKKILNPYNPINSTHAWIEYFAWTSSPIPTKNTLNSPLPFYNLKF